MKLPRWLAKAPKNRAFGIDKSPENVSIQVKNLTRRTVLASRLEVADTAAKRSKGLLGRSGLNSGEGLWIVPCESVHTIGMQFPIDLVYLDRKLRVKKVCSNVVPWRMSACLSAHSILELPAGSVRSTRTGRGDSLEFSDSPSVRQSADGNKNKNLVLESGVSGVEQ